MKIQKILGENVHKYRLIKQYTQEELAELSGLHRTYISCIELGKKNASLKVIENLANILEVDICNLFKEE